MSIFAVSLTSRFYAPHQIPHEMVTQSRNSYVEADLHAPTIGELCKQLEDDDGTYPTHMDGRLQNLLKEAREKSKYWISCSSSDNTELYYKKVAFLLLIMKLVCHCYIFKSK